MADDYLLEALTRGLQGFERAYVPFKQAQFEDELSTRSALRKRRFELEQAARTRAQNQADELSMFREQQEIKEPFLERQLKRETDAKLEIARETPNIAVDAEGNTIVLPAGKITKLPIPRVDAVDVAEKKMEAKKQAGKPKVRAFTRTVLDKLTDFENEVNGLINNPELGAATGFNYFMAGIPGTKGADIAAKIKNISAGSAFETLQEIRQNSPTGGAVGNVSDKDIELLINAATALDRKQSDSAFRESLRKLSRKIAQAKKRALLAYKETYGEDFHSDESPGGGLNETSQKILDEEGF